MRLNFINPRHLGWFISLMAPIVMTGHAHATSSIECSGINTDADVSILIGAGPVLNALEVSVGLNDRVISTYSDTKFEHGNIVQFQANEYELNVDLIDDQAAVLLASVRIIRYGGENDGSAEPFQIGYLAIDGEPVVGITCDGP